MYKYRPSGLQWNSVIPDPFDVEKDEMRSYEDENRETTLLNDPAVRMLSGETDSAETMPFDGRSNFVVLIEVCGTPGCDSEKIEMSEFVPQIKLYKSLANRKHTLRCHWRTSWHGVRDIVLDGRSKGMRRATSVSDNFESCTFPVRESHK